jgi:hypothetical protein
MMRFALAVLSLSAELSSQQQQEDTTPYPPCSLLLFVKLPGPLWHEQVRHFIFYSISIHYFKWCVDKEIKIKISIRHCRLGRVVGFLRIGSST